MWHLYVLRCNDGSFYTGITKDLDRRLEEHQSGRGAKYTRAHLPVSLIAAWRCADQGSAMAAEAAFKKLRRATKALWMEGRRPFMGAPFDFDRFGDGRGYRFCPRCGGALENRRLGEESVPVCSVCGRRNYLNAKPASGLLVLREGRLLLVRRRIEPYLGYWDIPGGFLHEEELPQEAALRETLEETGLEARIVDFLGFYMDHYDYQGDRYSILNVYFVAEAEGEACPGDDADDLCWFPLEALPGEIAFEHASRVLDDLRHWVHRRKEAL